MGPAEIAATIPIVVILGVVVIALAGIFTGMVTRMRELKLRMKEAELAMKQADAATSHARVEALENYVRQLSARLDEQVLAVDDIRGFRSRLAAPPAIPEDIRQTLEQR